MNPVADEHPLDFAARLLSGRPAMARLLCVRPSAIGNWKVRGVPWEHCPVIETLTAGRVTRAMLRPNDWQAMWPELATTTQHAVATITGEGANA